MNGDNYPLSSTKQPAFTGKISLVANMSKGRLDFNSVISRHRNKRAEVCDIELAQKQTLKNLWIIKTEFKCFANEVKGDIY